jgi:hypothetical protein
MLLIQQFLPSAVLAGIVAFVAAMVARLPAADWAKQLAFGVSVGGGYAAGHWKSAGWPGFPPSDVTHWLLFSAVASVVLGVGHGVGRGRWGIGVRVVSFAVLLSGTLALILMPKFKHGWTMGQGALWVAGLMLSAAIMGWSLEVTLRAGRTRLSLLWLLVIGMGASIALALSGSMLLGQFAAVFAAVVCGMIGASVAGAYAEGAIVPGMATLFVGLIACGYFYAELPWSSALLLAMSPALAMLIRSGGTLRQDLLRATIVSVTVAAAVVLALRASPPIDYY